MYLGVDGGGTKTAFVMLDTDGDIVARHTEPTCSHLEVGLDGMRHILRNGVQEVSRQSGIALKDLDFSFFGLPCYGEDSSLTDVLDEAPGVILESSAYRCGNDMICGWAAGAGCADGVHIVAGTGSIGYGERGALSARVGGWSEIFGDEGSAYWIARAGLEAFTRMSDGRMEKTLLHKLMAERLELSFDLDVCALVLSRWNGSRTKIASLSKLVAEAASLADPVALDIFDRAAGELALIAKSLIDKLQFAERDTVVATYSGGVFQAGALIIEPLEAALLAGPQRCVLKRPDYQPDIGAALYAAKLSGKALSGDSLNNLKFSRINNTVQ
ncbi:BadF/BadG/BcrA/BcrD ATPase family protein [uncultured Gilvimarinus sp.]|uniref:BadF/BadG/BcrA/BcrD ATPase family protein n=1 Tax=uncultured Gilvimarinus sp. TaxID=1689143 RepID=UPI0030ED9919|tara:strand:- start:7160 stop:8143 length:984 start_codon:yes stop_codon:yes gene_type:complete